jgi:uncharacterized protein (DUF1330 family)
MPKINLLTGFAAAALVILFAVYWWQHPGGKLTTAEIDSYLAAADRQLPMPPEEKAESLRRLRAWATADDGRPVYMLNLMRFYPQVRPLPGGPAADMTPADANAHYEDVAMPMLLGKGGSALFGGESQGANVLPYAGNEDNWSRMLVIRYPNRRAFLELVTDPRYATIMPYKLASLELILSPFDGQMVLPDPTLATAVVLLISFLAIGWWRARRGT